MYIDINFVSHVAPRICTFYYLLIVLGHHCVAELLLERGANRDCRTKTGITPLFQVIRLERLSY